MQVAPLRRNRPFVALWIGQAVSSLGISISSFAYPVVVLSATGSPAKAGLVGSVLAATTFFLRIPAGALVDRWDRRRILIACDGGRAAAAGSLGLALALGHFVFAHVLLVAFVEGSLGVLYGPSESAAVRRVVPPEQVREAVARNQSRSYLAGLLGPPLGGGLLALGRALPFLADAASYLAALAGVLYARRSLVLPRSERSGRHLLTEMLDGLRWIWGRPFLRALLLWLAGAGFVFNSLGLVVLVLARDRGASSGELGIMFALAAAGGVAGSLAAPRVIRSSSPRTLVVLFACTAGASTALLVPVHSPYLIGAIGGLAFLLAPVLSALAFSLVVADAPERLQGRAQSAAIQIASLSGPLSPLAAGLLLASYGAEAVIVISAGAWVALAVIGAALRPLRHGSDAVS